MGGKEAFEFVWDEEAIRFFWQARPVLERGFFTDKRVDLFSRLLRGFAPPPPARILEIGSGTGALLARLRRDGWRGLAVDTSWDLLARVRDRGIPGSVGAIIAMPVRSGSVDAVVMLEVAEHLLPGHAEAGLAEAARVLRPAGVLLLSTPHDENLERGRALCPNCGALFHAVQHLRSFTAASLRALVERCGFRTVLCLPTNLKQTWLPVSWAMRFRAWRRGLKGKGDMHLVYIGARTGQPPSTATPGEDG